MSETFVTANTKIEDLLSKRDQILEKTAGLVAEVILGRQQENNLQRSNEKDIQKMISKFSAEEQVIILYKALVLVGMNNNSSSSSYDPFDGARRKGGNSRSSLFR